MAKTRSQDLDPDFGYEDQYTDSADAQPSEQLDIQHYVRMLRKHKWPITLFTALTTALAAYYAYTATPVYESKAVLLIEAQKANVVSIKELYGIDSGDSDYYATQFELLKSRGLANKVVDKLGLENYAEFNPQIGQYLGEEGTGQPSGGNSAVESDTLSGMSQSAAGDTVQPERHQEGIDPLKAATLEQALSQAMQTVVEPSTESKERTAVVDRFMGGLNIAPVRNTKLVNIYFQSEDPELAATVANTVGEQYIKSYLDSKSEMTETANAWLEDRLKTLKATLDESEQRLLQYKTDNGLVDVNGSVGRLNEQELLLATTELSDAKRELSDISDLRREINSLKNTSPELLETLAGVQNDPLVRSVKLEQGQRQRELDELSNRYGAKHPKIVDAESRLDSLNKTLEGHIQRVVGSIEKEYQFLRQRVTSIEQTLASGKQEIQDIGSKSFELNSLEREVETNRDIYTTYFNRMSEARSADGLEAANAIITDMALPSLSPVKPKKQLIIALAALASLVLSVLMAFLYEQMDDTIGSTRDIEQKLGLTMLGLLPMIKNGVLSKKKSLPLNPLDIEDKKGTFFESVNTARTVLCQTKHGRDSKVITITSSIPGEGKSTTALNLAYSLAQMEKVLLIDCDMRRPTIAKALKFEHTPKGLSDLVVGTASPRECIHRNAIGSMDVICSGTPPDQPLEIISSARFVSMLEQLKKHYDRIVIDSAPTQAVSDALILGEMSDAVVYIIKSHETSFSLVERGIERLRQARAPIAGVIVTQVDMDKITSYGGDYYYQGYYDYYGYGEKRTTAKSKNDGSREKLQLSDQQLRAINKEDGFAMDFDDVFDGRGREQSSAPRHSNGSAHHSSPRHQEPVAKQQPPQAAAPVPSIDDDFDATTRLGEEDMQHLSEADKRNKRFIDDLDFL